MFYEFLLKGFLKTDGDGISINSVLPFLRDWKIFFMIYFITLLVNEIKISKNLFGSKKPLLDQHKKFILTAKRFFHIRDIIFVYQ